MMDNTKLAILRSEISEAIKDGTLDKQMDVFRLKAADIQLDLSQLDKIVAQEKKVREVSEKAKPYAKKNTAIIIIIMVVCLIAEFFMARSNDWGLLSTIIIMFVTLVVIVVAAAFVIRKNVKK